MAYEEKKIPHSSQRIKAYVANALQLNRLQTHACGNTASVAGVHQDIIAAHEHSDANTRIGNEL